MSGSEEGRLRRAVRRLTAETTELDAEDLQKRGEGVGATPLVECRDRSPVTVFGTVRAITIRPRAGVPALEAELFDGSGTVTLVWLGRRTLAGVDAGRQLRASGRLTTGEGRRLIYNPRYELVPQDA
ncbi:MAG TPA: OB-fold nucleic acid binding domain-containing protein [Mycobacteriales bacterium]|nr:OB-fold nucleic acid binding domain-containing protein [Mycobacteriales bacterium]